MVVENVRTRVVSGNSRRPETNAKLIEVAPGLVAPSPVFVMADVDGLEVELTVVAVPGEDGRAGRLMCSHLEVRQTPGGPPVTTDLLRSVPIMLLIKYAGATVRDLVDRTTGLTTVRVLTEERRQELREAGPTAATLEWVAYLYRLATVLGEPPLRSVETTFEIPRSTAGGWVAQARKRGFLGPAEGPGKAAG